MTATPNSPVVIIARGWAAGDVGPCPHDGEFLERFDHEADGGRGYGVFTADPTRAQRFPDAGAALEFWRRVSRTRPLRPDGRPNRPLTALTVEVVPLRKLMQ